MAHTGLNLLSVQTAVAGFRAVPASARQVVLVNPAHTVRGAPARRDVRSGTGARPR